MIKAIQESLYRWQQEGWEVQKVGNEQYTLVHPNARPVVCGLRTSFQTVGAIQGEMKRALQDGPPKQAAVFPPPDAQLLKKKKKSKPQRKGENHFSFEPPQASRPNAPPSIFRRRPQVVAEPAHRRHEPFENAAWELASLKLIERGVSQPTIDKMLVRYQSDADYRYRLIDAYRKTSHEEIQSLRQRIDENATVTSG